MTTFDDLFSAMGSPVLVDQHGEPIVYRPKGGKARTISVIVLRGDGLQSVGIPHAFGPGITIKAYNDDETGIDATTLNTGGDKVDVSVVKGGEVTTRNITDFLGVHGGMTVVRVR